ncbi:MAG TPA: hypothetical protein VH593_25100, partial [Ktedonobacteraceae bacterium]
ALHRGAIAYRLHTYRIDIHLAPPTDQRDQTGHVAALDITGHEVVHTGEPHFRQSSNAHCLFPPFYLTSITLLTIGRA